MSSPGDQPLTPVERAIIDSIRQGAPDAEISARLGISIVDVKHKVEVLKQRFNVDERTALGLVDPDAPMPPEEAGAESPGTEPLELPGIADTGFRERFTRVEEDEAPVHSRRAVLGALFAGGAAVAGAAVYYLASGGNSRQGSGGADPFATITPTPTSMPPPTPTPHPGLSVVRPDPGARERRSFANGQPLDMEHGIGFVDTETGETEVLQLATSRWRSGGIYQVSPRNDLVATTWSRSTPRPPGTLYRRSTGESWSWDAELLQHLVVTDELIVFQRIEVDGIAGTAVRHSGVFDVAGPSMEPISRFELPPAPPGLPYPPMAVSGDRRHLASMHGGDLHIVDIRSGTLQTRALPEVPGLQPMRVELHGADGPGAFAISGYARTDESGGRGNLQVVIDAAGNVVSTGEITAWGTRAFSPDGRFRLIAGSLRRNYLQDSGPEDWIYTEMLESEGEASQFRVLSGRLSSRRPWLADSSGFLVEAPDHDPALETYEDWLGSRQFYLVDTEGEMAAIPPGPVEGEALHRRLNGLEPSPRDPDLMSMGGVLVWDRATNRLLGPGDPPGVAPIDPWGEATGEMRFAFPSASGALGELGTMLPPLVERPPYREDVRVAVARAEPCLNLRVEPSLESDVLACIPEGTELTVAGPGGAESGVVSGSPRGYQARVIGLAEQMFVHVRAASGEQGWVAVQYLDWAP